MKYSGRQAGRRASLFFYKETPGYKADDNNSAYLYSYIHRIKTSLYSGIVFVCLFVSFWYNSCTIWLSIRTFTVVLYCTVTKTRIISLCLWDFISLHSPCHLLTSSTNQLISSINLTLPTLHYCSSLNLSTKMITIRLSLS
jgi:hypothetical protein